MATRRDAETGPKKIRTIQTFHFGKSNIDIKLARKTLLE